MGSTTMCVCTNIEWVSKVECSAVYKILCSKLKGHQIQHFHLHHYQVHHHHRHKMPYFHTVSSTYLCTLSLPSYNSKTPQNKLFCTYRTVAQVLHLVLVWYQVTQSLSRCCHCLFSTHDHVVMEFLVERKLFFFRWLPDNWPLKHEALMMTYTMARPLARLYPL